MFISYSFLFNVPCGIHRLQSILIVEKVLVFVSIISFIQLLLCLWNPCYSYSDHWRKNIAVLAKSHRVYSIDLIGYGYSAKPNPRQFGDSLFYTFETWASQLNEFCNDVVKDEAFFICNSIGGDYHLKLFIYLVFIKYMRYCKIAFGKLVSCHVNLFLFHFIWIEICWQTSSMSVMSKFLLNI